MMKNPNADTRPDEHLSANIFVNSAIEAKSRLIFTFRMVKSDDKYPQVEDS